MKQTGSLSAGPRIFSGTTIAVLAFFLLAGGWAIPFHFESQSILYKFGLEKAYLRSAKVIGITVALLVSFQIIFVARFAILERIFSRKILLFLHRTNGIAIIFLIVSHPLLIKASENFIPYTFAKKYVPEFLGIALLALLLAVSLTAVCKNVFKISYARWLLLHRLKVSLALAMMPSHILYVSETFQSGAPRHAALIIFTLNLLMITRIWVLRLRRHSAK
ncbi:MAG: hypothetical protein R3297_07010 [Desulfobulbales bacterium]|nr:hypothetical protein [Desulfobulbales bacterium]